MKLSDVKTFRDLCASFFVLHLEPEDEPKPKTKRKRKRARTKSGRYKADNPATKDVNEAWEQEEEKNV